ncbi:MAG: O-antigen ligase family protein [Rubrivivax sp.]|nr:O-antigen ligase family protein [Rubrivivax sp.]
MALALVMTIPLMRYLPLQEQSKNIKLGLAVAMFLTVIATVGSQSRGAVVGLAVTGTIFWLKSRNKITTGLFVGIAGLVALSIMPAEYFERMNTIKTYDEDASALGRINAWWTAWNVANARPFGGGYEMLAVGGLQLYAPRPGNVPRRLQRSTSRYWRARLDWLHPVHVPAGPDTGSNSHAPIRCCQEGNRTSSGPGPGGDDPGQSMVWRT